MLRPATLEDLDALVDLENISFDSDGFSRRVFRYLLTEAHAETLVIKAFKGSDPFNPKEHLLPQGSSD